MIGRDLILYILQNHLEDEPVFKDGTFIGFMNLGKAAEKFNVGVETVKIWYQLGYIDGIKIDNDIFIKAGCESPLR